MIIGLTGAAFAGKDSAANYLSRAHNFSVFAFADPIRKALIAGLDLDPSVFQPENKETVIDWLGISPRQLMQSLGTDWGRERVCASIWVNLMLRRIKRSAHSGDVDIVISDVRFLREAQLIYSIGGTVWRVIRPHAATTAHAHHVSELEGAGIVVERNIINDGTLEQLYEAVDAILFPAQQVA